MTIEELMMDDVLGRSAYIYWEQQVRKSVTDIARDKIRDYFDNCPDYNAPYAFVTYQLRRECLSFFEKLFKRNPVFEDWIFKGDNKGEINVAPFSKRNRKGNINIEDYLPNVTCVSITFMLGSNYNDNCVIDSNNGFSRIGKIPELK